MADRESKDAAFNNRNEKEGMQDAFRSEHQNNQENITKTNNELSTGDSVRNFGEVSGTTFGMQSNPAEFSNIGQKNQLRKGEDDSNLEDVNKADRQEGSGGTMYSDYLNQAQNQFISNTGQFANNEEGNSTQPFDAMQGNRESGTEGRNDTNEDYTPESNTRSGE